MKRFSLVTILIFAFCLENKTVFKKLICLSLTFTFFFLNLSVIPLSSSTVLMFSFQDELQLLIQCLSTVGMY